MTRSRNKGCIAKKFKIGNTGVYIHTDYCLDKTQEDIDKILRRIAVMALKDFAANSRSHNESE
ncbi:MAG: hypothetical protein LUC97_09940 [Clostridiales bacterium]|nr:hypothetical protein [Clostridiales bacterium]